ncbi:BTAD domain-containing putative transcriptional regulator [Streptomyces sp. NPDC048424]|uniref:AfsR/SARP family transcriptional regulator n=1 Tax=Streptomyces sp. NPDC048424 TaxID=3155265 RepID=UPI003431B59F
MPRGDLPKTEFRLLGPVEAWRDEGQLTIAGRKPRALLAALLLEHGQVVSAEMLIDRVWGDSPPDSARTLVQTYVWVLRRALGDVIESRPAGYRIRVAPAWTDRDRFAELAARGSVAAADGRHAEAVALFAQGLDLWRGPALGGIGEALRVAAAGLDEERLVVMEQRAQAQLDAGTPVVLAELRALVAAHPTRERARKHLMLALHRAGRHAEALEVFAQGRQALADELGVEPGPDLQALHVSILRAGGEAGGHASARTVARNGEARSGEAGGGEAGGERGDGVPAVVPVPALLPPATADFTARARPLAELVRHLVGAGGDTAATRTALPVCVISGTGGVGKSALAVEAAHRTAAAYPDGHLYADLSGASAAATPEEVLARFLRALGRPVPDGLNERVDLFRTTLAGRRMLLVLDDAGSEAQVRPLLPGAASCAVLVTSRSRLPALTGAHRIELDVLGPAEAVALLARVAGAERVAAEPAAAQRIARLCGHLPLALRTAGARLATRRHWTLHTLVERLSDEYRRLDELAVGDIAVRASVALSYEALDDGARRAFRLLGALGVPDFAPWLVTALLDTDPRTADDTVERLTDAHLLSVVSEGHGGGLRYRLHDLHRVYAAERATVEDAPQLLRDAATRALGSWLWLIRRHAAAAPSGELEMCAHYTTARAGAPVAEDAAAWYESEAAALVAAVERAAALDLALPAREVALALGSSSFGVANRFEEWWRTHDAAIAATRRAGDRSGEAMLLAGLGQLRYSQDRYGEALAYFEQARALVEKTDDLRGLAVVLAGTGSVHREQGRFAAARAALSRAAEGFRVTRDDAGLGYASRLAASVDLEQGRHEQALTTLKEALSAYRRLGSRRGVALTLRTTGLVHRALGDHPVAERLFEQALGMLQDLGDELMIAYTRLALSKTRIRLGTATLPPLLDALAVCRAHHDTLGEGMALRTLGEFHLAAGRPEQAAEPLLHALRVWEPLGVPLFRARAMRDLADVREAQEAYAEAAALRAEALAVFTELEAREQAESLVW